MFKLTIVFGPTATAWLLLFKTEEISKTAFNLLDKASEQTVCCVSDDFSQAVRIKKSDIHGLMLENMEVSKLAHVSAQVYIWKMQADAQAAAAADPALRAAAGQAQRGPGVITSMGMNGRGY